MDLFIRKKSLITLMGLFSQNQGQGLHEIIREKLKQEKNLVLKCNCGHFRNQHYYDISRRKHEEFNIKWAECPLCTCIKFEKDEMNF